jgi:hypothetical protein
VKVHLIELETFLRLRDFTTPATGVVETVLGDTEIVIFDRVTSDGVALTQVSDDASVDATNSTWHFTPSTHTLRIHLPDDGDSADSLVLLAVAVEFIARGATVIKARTGDATPSVWEGRGCGLPRISQKIAPEELGSGSLATLGDLTISNEDGRYETLLGQRLFIGGAVRIWFGDADTPFTSLDLWLKAEMDAPSADASRMTIPLRSLAAKLSQPALTHTFEVTEFPDMDPALAGVNVPKTYGTVKGALAGRIDTGTWKWSDIATASIDSVLKGDGTAVTVLSSDLANGTFTVDTALDTESRLYVYGRGADLDYPGALISAIVQGLGSGLDATDLDAGALTDLDTSRPVKIGFQVTTGSVRDVLDKIAASALIVYFVDRSDILSAQPLQRAVTATETLVVDDVIASYQTSSPHDAALWRARSPYALDLRTGTMSFISREDSRIKTLATTAESRILAAASVDADDAAITAVAGLNYFGTGGLRATYTIVDPDIVIDLAHAPAVSLQSTRRPYTGDDRLWKIIEMDEDRPESGAPQTVVTLEVLYDPFALSGIGSELGESIVFGIGLVRTLIGVRFHRVSSASPLAPDYAASGGRIGPVIRLGKKKLLMYVTEIFAGFVGVGDSWYHEFWRSDDNGFQWTLVSTQLTGDADIFGMYSPLNNQAVVGSSQSTTEFGTLHWIWRTVDGGVTWTAVQPRIAPYQFWSPWPNTNAPTDPPGFVRFGASDIYTKARWAPLATDTTWTFGYVVTHDNGASWTAIPTAGMQEFEGDAFVIPPSLNTVPGTESFELFTDAYTVISREPAKILAGARTIGSGAPSVTASSTGKASGTTLVIGSAGAPIAVKAGDVVVVAFADLIGGSPATISDTLGHAWTALAGPTTNGAVRGSKWRTIVTVPGDMVVTVAHDSSAAARAGALNAWPAAYFEASPFDVNPTDASDATSPYTAPSTGTLGQADELVLAFIFLNGVDGIAASTPSILGAHGGTSGGAANTNAAVAISWRVVASTSAVAPEFTDAVSIASVVGAASAKINAPTMTAAPPTLFRSVTGGASWTRVQMGAPAGIQSKLTSVTGILDLGGGLLLATVTWTDVDGTTGVSIYRSTNNGASWTEVTQHPGFGVVAISDLGNGAAVAALSGEESGTCWIWTGNSGATWTGADVDDAFDEGTPLPQGLAYEDGILISPLTEGADVTVWQGIPTWTSGMIVEDKFRRAPGAV